jgi:gliding motility-associated-like protein
MPLTAIAQLTAPGANAVRYTSYPSAPGVRDPVFIFCNAAGTRLGALNATSPGGTGPYNFSWYKWSDATASFSQFLKTETGLMSSSANNLEEGGYRVNISDGGGYTATLTAWVFLDKPYALATLLNRTCDYVALSGKVAIDTFYYRDPSGGNRVRLPNGIRFRWSSDPPSSIPFPEIELNPITFSPPLVDVTYKLQATDSFTCVNESSFYYESIHIKADFSVSPDRGDAPLEVNFTDKSVRGFKYRWEFGDDTVSLLDNPGQHIYYIPGEYTVKLTIESELHCIDSVRFSKIVVNPSALQIPNVFTPDGDGFNDHFVVASQSLRYINVDIFSRSGLKVYSFDGQGDRLREWTGWDGNVNNSSVKAAPGIYFYVIKAKGWDDVVYDNKEYRGFVYLYR